MDSPAVEPAQRLKQLRDGLIRLHKTLLDSERYVYEHDIERVTSNGRMLELVVSDPYFAWLHRISELIVEIDERLDNDEEPAGPAEAGQYIGQTRALLVPSEDGSEFERRYHNALQRDPDVVIAHGRMMAVLGSLG